MAEVEVVSEAGVHLVEDLVVVGAVGRAEVGPAVDGEGVQRDGREDLGDAAVPVQAEVVNK